MPGPAQGISEQPQGGKVQECFCLELGKGRDFMLQRAHKGVRDDGTEKDEKRSRGVDCALFLKPDSRDQRCRPAERRAVGQLEDPQRAGCRGTGMGASGLGPLTTYATQSCSGSECSGESPGGTDESTSQWVLAAPQNKERERSRQTSHGDSGPDPAAPLLGMSRSKGAASAGG